MSDTTSPLAPPLPASMTTGSVDPFVKAVSDISDRITAGATARGALTDRTTATEQAAAALTTRVAALEVAPVPAATLTKTGGVLANVTLFQRTPTTSPVSVALAAITLATAGFVPSVSVTVPGVLVGDAAQATFASTAPAGLTVTGAVVTAKDTVLVTFYATQALTIAANTKINMNFFWQR